MEEDFFKKGGSFGTLILFFFFENFKNPKYPVLLYVLFYVKEDFDGSLCDDGGEEGEEDGWADAESDV